MKGWSSTSERRSALASAALQHDLVRLRRRFRRADPFDGYIAGIGRKWVLVQRFHTDSAPLGYSATRVEDITGMTRCDASDFLSRACDALDYVAEPLGDADLDSTARLLLSLGRSFPLVTIHDEDDDPDICFIGRVSGASSGRLRLRELSPRAIWDEADTSWSLRDITRIDVGGHYEHALAAIVRQPD